MSGGEDRADSPSEPALARALGTVNGIFGLVSVSLGCSGLVSLPTSRCLTGSWRAWGGTCTASQSCSFFPLWKVVTWRHCLSPTSPHLPWDQVLGFIYSPGVLVALKRDTLFRFAHNKALESKGRCLWIWMVLKDAHAQEDCYLLLPRKQPYCRAPKEAPCS